MSVYYKHVLYWWILTNLHLYHCYECLCLCFTINIHVLNYIFLFIFCGWKWFTVISTVKYCSIAAINNNKPTSLYIQSGTCIYMYECQHNGGRSTLLEFRFSRSKMPSPLDFELPRVNCIYFITRYCSKWSHYHYIINHEKHFWWFDFLQMRKYNGNIEIGYIITKTISISMCMYMHIQCAPL
jgi:hypothetical protein